MKARMLIAGTLVMAIFEATYALAGQRRGGI
jgi:hypothetical protein